MSDLIFNKTSAYLDESNANVKQINVNYTSNSYLDANIYPIMLPVNVNVFSSLSESIMTLEDKEVAKQVNKILSCLYLSLKKAINNKSISNYLPRLHLTQQDDMSALIEWNFQNFRIGFILDTNKDENYFFMISQNKIMNSYKSDLQKLDVDNFVYMDEIIKYVLENT